MILRLPYEQRLEKATSGSKDGVTSFAFDASTT